MVKKISIKQLIGDVVPVLEIELEDKVYPIVKTDDLPERFYVRLLEANLEFSDISAALDKELSKKEKKGISDVERLAIANRQIVLQSKLVTPARLAIESMAQMDEGSLRDVPAHVIETLYKEINEALNYVEGDKEDEKGKQEETDQAV